MDGVAGSDQQLLRSDLTGRQIVLVGMYYSPETTGSAPYTTDTAEFLARCGAEVRVITTAPHYPQWERLGSARPGWVRERINGVDVHRVPTYIPKQPTLVKRLVYESLFTAAASPLLLGGRVDVVIGTSPNLFSAALAATYARMRRRPLLQLVQDVVSSAVHQTEQGEERGAAARALAAVESRALAEANYVTVPTDAFRPALTALGVREDRIVTVPNWSRLVPGVAADPALIRARRGWGRDFVVLHTGNIGYKQGLDQLIPSIRAMGGADGVRFVFMGSGNQRDVLERAAAGVPGVDIQDPVSNEEYLGTLQAADVLLVHEASSVRDMSLPSKLTSYFAAGKPVIAIGHATGATAAEVRRSGAGFLVPHGGSKHLRNTLDLLRRNEDLAADLGTRGLRYRQECLMPEAGLRRIASLVDEVLQTRPGSAASSPSTS